MVYLFREFQRCRSELEYPLFKGRFYERLEHACMTGEVIEAPMGEVEYEEWAGIGQAGDDSDVEMLSVSSLSSQGRNSPPSHAVGKARFKWIKKYMENYWFTPFWLPYVTDMSFPPGKTRDGSYNTNNFTEAAWLVIDKSILNMRANKRIDHLLLLLRTHFFPLYEYWPPGVKSIPREIEEMYALAYNLWDLDFVKFKGKREYLVQESSKYGEVVAFEAATIFEKNGSVKEWQGKLFSFSASYTTELFNLALESSTQMSKPVNILGLKSSSERENSKKQTKMGLRADRWQSDIIVERNFQRILTSLSKSEDSPQEPDSISQSTDSSASVPLFDSTHTEGAHSLWLH
ncbi:hypothetical protein M422DRAFT_43171 [Sphaerobolus stellatus SS14]|nr:hypothetical protein M422DRAFT_43171 [Sphaerobolus stellatus SS14]